MLAPLSNYWGGGGGCPPPSSYAYDNASGLATVVMSNSVIVHGHM